MLLALAFCLGSAQNVVLVGGGMYDPNIVSQFVGLAGSPQVLNLLAKISNCYSDKKFARSPARVETRWETLSCSRTHFNLLSSKCIGSQSPSMTPPQTRTQRCLTKCQRVAEFIFREATKRTCSTAFMTTFPHPHLCCSNCIQ